jgi:hypothetical protein
VEQVRVQFKATSVSSPFFPFISLCVLLTCACGVV